MSIPIPAALFLCATLIGCAPTSAPQPEIISTAEPVGLQMLRTEAQLQKYPFRTLLDFEAPTDSVFVRLDGASARVDASRHHTGQNCLILDPGCKSAVIRLPSLFSGSKFPGRWALAGAYFFSSNPQRLTASYDVDGKPLTSITVELPAGQWTPILLDVASVCDGKDLPIGTLRFAFSAPLAAPIWCDDVVVIDNTQTHVESSLADGWIIRERGFQYTLDHPGFFKISIPTPEASSAGWTVTEANPIRACFTSASKRNLRVIYAEGMQIIDGQIESVTGRPDAALAQQHATPAKIEVPSEMGRVDRNSPGDANNDGYAETTATYQIIAAGPRLNLTIIPQTPSLAHPVLEIANLPPGKLLVNMEGRAVDRILRLPNGHTLIAIPGVLTRPTQINVRVSQ